MTGIVIIGGSAGSLEVLMHVLPELALGLPFPIVIVLHRKNGDDTTLEELFAMKTALAVKEVVDKTKMVPGTLYIVPADYHLLFESDGSLALDDSEKVNYSRPSIDVVFESAAVTFGKHAAVFLLSGSNSDGALGCESVKKNQGKVFIQNPQTAEMPYMPNAALQLVSPDALLDPDEIAGFVNQL